MDEIIGGIYTAGERFGKSGSLCMQTFRVHEHE